MTVLNDLYDTTLAAIDSADKLCEVARPFIQKKAQRLVGRAGITPSDQSDIEQEAYIRLIERFEKARAMGNLPVLFFIKRVVEQSLANQIRDRKAKRRDFRRTVSLHRREADFDGAELADLLRDNSPYGKAQTWWHWQKTIDIKDTIAKLKPEEQELCVKLGIITVAEIVRDTKLPRSTVQGQVERLSCKLRAHELRTGA